MPQALRGSAPREQTSLPAQDSLPDHLVYQKWLMHLCSQPLVRAPRLCSVGDFVVLLPNRKKQPFEQGLHRPSAPKQLYLLVLERSPPELAKTCRRVGGSSPGRWGIFLLQHLVSRDGRVAWSPLVHHLTETSAVLSGCSPVCIAETQRLDQMQSWTETKAHTVWSLLQRSSQSIPILQPCQRNLRIFVILSDTSRRFQSARCKDSVLSPASALASRGSLCRSNRQYARFLTPISMLRILHRGLERVGFFVQSTSVLHSCAFVPVEFSPQPDRPWSCLWRKGAARNTLRAVDNSDGLTFLDAKDLGLPLYEYHLCDTRNRRKQNKKASTRD
ncbi:hypothetical protein KCU73_g168, partial [Aureobasidium melanogenum]